MFIRLFLKLNSLFQESAHPFNQVRDGKQMLNYSEYEFENAGKTFSLFDRFCSFADFIKNKKVVDFCCGGGGKSVYLASIGADEVVGIDMNQIFIDQANEIARKHSVDDRCRFLCESVTDTSLPSDSYDVVILNDAIDHISDPEKALAEAHRVLKTGGKIFINFESYFYFWGHHLWDAVRIPWLHLFTTESFRIRLYKAAVERYPDAGQRVSFRISKDKNGVERITYLNHLTLRRFRKILKKLESCGLKKESSYIMFPRRFILKALATVPYLRELFISTILVVLKKEPVRVSVIAHRAHRAIQQIKTGIKKALTMV
ncbi:MAG: class I SAM-dependent methyltransferase [Patescibacteria group bacterium]